MIIEHVAVSGDAKAYTFNVTLASDDTGCQQYANWWEVIDETGKTLIYRRTLGHSHIDEQPFTRNGGPVEIEEDQIIIIRAHLYPNGYSTNAFKGSVINGFTAITLSDTFAQALAEQQPLPSTCAF